MLKFIIDKIRENDGPLKSARLVIADIAEETVDVVSHYMNKIRKKSTAPSPAQPVKESVSTQNTSEAEVPPTSVSSSRKTKSPTKPKKSGTTKKTKAPEKKLKRTLDVSTELALALDTPANQRKQEFKVLAILWDAKQRNQNGMSAKDLSDHGAQLGLAIRHENIRKVIKMRLSTYVEIMQEANNRSSIYHYRLNDVGDTYFREKYLA